MPIAVPDFTNVLAAVHGVHVKCVWCRRLEQDGTWTATAEEETHVIHGVCPACAMRLGID
jgi:formate dehydrogenase maturation protein FdhE